MFSVPDKTSIWEKEPENAQYVIPFAPELIQFILDKRKMTTYRFGYKYDYLNPGDLVTLTETNSNKVAVPAAIKSKTVMPFSEIPLKVDGHEAYRSKDHQRRVFSGYHKYIGREIADEDPFLVIEFSLVE